MKKIFILAVAFLLIVSSAWAATNVTNTAFGNAGQELHGHASTATKTTPLIGKTSTGVGLGMLVSAAGTGYSLVTQHRNGTKAYGSAYDSTSIYATVSEGTAGTVILAVPTATDASDFSSSAKWKAM